MNTYLSLNQTWKKAAAVVIFCSGTFMATSAFIVKQKAYRATGDLLTELGITSKQAQENIWNSVKGNYLSYSGKVNVLKNMAPEKRGAAMQEILSIVRAYVESPEYNTRYQTYREEFTPKKPLTVDEERAKMVSDIKRNIAEMEKSRDEATAENKKIFDESIGMFKTQLKLYTDPKNPDYAAYLEMMKQTYTYSVKNYQDEMKKWEKKYPEDPRLMVKERMKRFMELSAGIDFNAELKDGPRNKKYFVNPAYEKKSADWKKCFRMGKEAVTAARTFMESWIQEIK